MGRHKFIPHEKLVRARWLYEHTRTPVAEIAAFLDMPVGTFHWRLSHKWKWTSRTDPLRWSAEHPRLSATKR